jgi:hypothetical protein
MKERNSLAGNVWNDGKVVTESKAFFNHYESNGWMVGKNKMANWSASVKNWIAKDYNQQTQVIVNKPKFGTLEDE